MSGKDRRRILIVDNERNFYSKLKDIFGNAFSFEHTSDPNKIASLIWPNIDQFAAVLMDLNFHDRGYTAGLYEILPNTYQVIRGQFPIIVCTNYDRVDTEHIAKEKGATLLLRKTKDYQPVDWKQQIEQTIDNFFKPEDGKQQLPVNTSDGFIAVTTEMQTLKDDLAILPQFLPNASVLLLGETGVGKEVAAKFLHQSKCKIKGDLPFMALNLSTISNDLIASELFGHKKGAFTGAIRDKEGMFKKAGKGTLFLDEIGEISLDVQVKLLRVLEEKKFRPVGKDEEVLLEAQVIFATNKNLQREIEIGNFRQDFYERISAYVYDIPPLKHRIAEIVPLVDHFLQQPDICPPDFHFFGKSAEECFSSEALEKLCQYHWPGNIRELRNMLQKILFAVFKTRKRVVDVSLLPPLLTSEATQSIDKVIPIIDHFLQQPDICHPDFRFFRQSAEQSFTVEALEKLSKYHWPGQMQELRNTLQKILFAASKAQKTIIDASLLPHRFHHISILDPISNVPQAVLPVQPHPPEITQWALDKQTAYLELKNAEQELINSGGRKNDAAQQLGMKNDQTLRYMIKKHYGEYEELFSFFPTIVKVYKL